MKKHNKVHFFTLLSFLSFLLGFALRYQGVIKDSVTLLFSVLILFIIGVVFLRKYKKRLPIPELSGLFLVFISLFVDKTLYFPTVVYGILNPATFAIFGFLCIRIYDVKLEYEFKSVKKIFIILGVSLLFAYFFLLLNEPFPTFIKDSFVVLFIYTFFVSLGEELVFRGTSYPLTKRLFSEETAVHVQAIIFTIIHLLSVSTLYLFYELNGGSLILRNPGINILIYGMALYGFSVIAARYAKGKKETNISYPIYFHWLVNFFNLAMLML